MTNDVQQKATVLITAAVLVLVPFVAPNSFYLDLATKTCLAAVVCVGLNLLVGYTGQISLGHAAFFGLGAYISAILSTRFGITPIVALVAGALFVAALAYGVARAILRLKGHYLAMATLALGVILSIILTREIAITGGPDGMSVSRFTIFGYPLTGTWMNYGLAALALLVAIRTSMVLVNSRVGRALRAIRDSEVAAESVGIDVGRYKTVVFVVSAVFASVAGSIFAHADRFITPGEAGFMRSVEYLAMIVIGGLGSVIGAVTGAVILSILPQFLAMFDHFRHLLIGVVLVFIMMFMPSGIVPTIRRAMEPVADKLAGGARRTFRAGRKDERRSLRGTSNGTP